MTPSGESLGSYLELNETSVNIDFINNIFAIWLQGEWSYSPPIQEVPPLDLIGDIQEGIMSLDGKMGL